jgi:hypothetical protein
MFGSKLPKSINSRAESRRVTPDLARNAHLQRISDRSRFLPLNSAAAGITKLQ